MNEFHTPVGIILPSEALGQHRKTALSRPWQHRNTQNSPHTPQTSTSCVVTECIVILLSTSAMVTSPPILENLSSTTPQ